jgi:peroxisomal membrane protein 2
MKFSALAGFVVTFQKTLAFQPLHIHHQNNNGFCRGPIRSSKLAFSPVEAWTAYNEALEASPLAVKSVTAGVLLGAADLTGQALERAKSLSESDSIDWGRAGRFAFFGLVLQAPWNHFYYELLDGTIPPTVDPFTATNAVKVGIDQFVQAPIFTVLIFAFLGFLEGKSSEAIKKQLDNDYKDTLIANWKLWVPATMINIGFVPPLLRVLYLNVIFFGWSIFLSLKLNKKNEEL